MSTLTSLQIADLHIDDDGVLVVEHHRGTTTDDVGALQLLHAIRDACPAPRYAVVSINGSRATFEGRQVLAGPDAIGLFAAAAMVVGSRFGKVMGNFFLRVNRPPCPTRIFTSREDARAWILDVRERHRQAGH